MLFEQTTLLSNLTDAKIKNCTDTFFRFSLGPTEIALRTGRDFKLIHLNTYDVIHQVNVELWEMRKLKNKKKRLNKTN